MDVKNVLPPAAAASQPHPPVVPVKWLLHWQPKPGTTLSSQIVTEICQCVEEGALGNVSKEGRWKTSLTFYRPIPRDAAAAASGAVPADLPRDFLGVALHDHPGLYLFILRPQRLVLQAEASIQMLMERLQSYKARFALNFEGLQYRLGDFRVRVGKCVPALSETLRGIMMEVEYLPLSSLEVSRMVMESFFDIWQEALSKKSLPGHFINIESNFAEYGLQDIYTPQHTAIQYASCMAQLMAAVRNQ